MKPTLDQLRQLVGNPLAYAVQQKDGNWFPRREWLTDAVLIGHLRNDYTIGTYTLKGDQARTLVIDLDMAPIDCARALVAIRRAARDLALPQQCLGVENSGRKGLHVWVVLQDFVQASRLRALGRALTVDLDPTPEIFPKQDSARDLGNLVKLPGGIHRVSGRPNNFVTPFPRILPLDEFGSLMQSVPEVRSRLGGESPPPFHCLDVAQTGAPEGSRNHHLFQLAVMARRSGLNDDSTRLVVEAAAARANPPYDEDIEQLLESSKHSGPICSQLPESSQCGENCILERTPGLYTRVGVLRYAAEGQKVVVEVGPRRGQVVELRHDDLSDGKGVIDEG